MKTCAWACLSYFWIKSFEFRFPGQQKESAFVIFVLNFGFVVGCKRKINENERNCVTAFSSFIDNFDGGPNHVQTNIDIISFVELLNCTRIWKFHFIPYDSADSTLKKLSDLATILCTGTWKHSIEPKDEVNSIK